MEARISRDCLPLRITVAVQPTNESVHMAVDILEYGVEVDIRPPPSHKVIEESEVG